MRMRSLDRGLLLVLAGLSLGTAGQPLAAQPTPATSLASPAARAGTVRKFVYRAEGKRLSEVLQDFAASQGRPCVVGDGVEGVVNASFDTTPQQFLQAVSKAYGILWYDDGTALFFYPGRSIQSRLFQLKGYSRRQVSELLASLGMGDKRYPLKFDEARRTLLAYGPPRHLELVASALESLDLGTADANERVVRVFALRFASAGDRRMGDMVVPGVASTLRSLYWRSTSDAGGDTSQQAQRPLAQKMKAMQGLGAGGRMVPELPSAHGGGEGGGGKAGAQGSERGLRSPVNFEEDQPSFEPDEGTNSIIVQGRAYRMREYETLIRRLDQKPVQVELEAMIIDVSSDSSRSLGIDWSVKGEHGGVSVTSPGGGPPEAGGAALLGSTPFTVSTVLQNAGRELIARINALAGEGKARVMSKPSVLGVANRPAVMKEKRVATVRVAGNLEANLFQLEAGTMLQVTPQVTSVDGINQIKLSLYIEDGSFETRAVDQVPVIKKTEIRTEAHVKEGESLLIGGLMVEADAQQEAGVPGLRSLPLIGGLFRWNGSRKTRTERLFLITPKLVGQGAAPAPAPVASVPASAASAASAAQPPADVAVADGRVRDE